ncbi:MAG: glycoside hydrolase family 15 protein [Chthoniobacterales bacterium]
MTPIKDYALIGNCETTALINPEGGIDWLCLPTFDSPSLCARLLDDEKGGDFTLRPAGDFESERAYHEDSAVFVTRFRTPRGVVRLTDFFVTARQVKARFYDFTSLYPARKLVRLLELEEGGAAVEMELHFRARPDYARTSAAWREEDKGTFALEAATLFTNASLAVAGDDLLGRFSLPPGEPIFAVLDYGEKRRPADLRQVYEWLALTKAFWREWNLFNYYNGPHRALVRRSAVTLKLLSYAATGAFVAAPTTSLPEGLGGDLNWDYRYTWLRDTALFIQTLFGLGYSGEASRFLDFAVRKWSEDKDRGDDSSLRVLYPICENPVPPETKLEYLAGYGGSRPVRIGNGAEDQFQLDNYGHILLSLFYFRHTGGKIDAQRRQMVEEITAEVIKLWRRDDNGIWEVREKHAFTYGKIMCWLALARARDLLGGKNEAIERACAALQEEIMTHCLTNENGEQILSAELNKHTLDASSFLAFTAGFCRKTSPAPRVSRSRKSWAAIPWFTAVKAVRKKRARFCFAAFGGSIISSAKAI